MFITPSFKKSLIVEQFQGNYLKFMSDEFIPEAAWSRLKSLKVAKYDTYPV